MILSELSTYIYNLIYSYLNRLFPIAGVFYRYYDTLIYYIRQIFEIITPYIKFLADALMINNLILGVFIAIYTGFIIYKGIVYLTKTIVKWWSSLAP